MTCTDLAREARSYRYWYLCARERHLLTRRKKTTPELSKSPFGPDRDWTTVQKQVLYFLHRKFPYVQEADIEDACSASLVDLLDYWVELPSTPGFDPEDPTRNFNFAVRRARLTAQHILIQGLEDRSHEVSLVDRTDDEHEKHLASLTVSEGSPLVPHEPSAEDVVLRKQTLDIAREFLAGLPREALRLWLLPFLLEESPAAESARTGEAYQTIYHRRLRGLQAIVTAAERAGLR